jgi:small membrane protein
MKLIQVPLLLIIALALLRTVQRFREGRVRPVDLIAWVALWVAGGLVVLLPERANELAHAFGVTRGADLVLYVGVVVLFYFVLQAHVRIEWLKSDITKLTRKLALAELANTVHANGDGAPAGRRTAPEPGVPGTADAEWGGS